MNYMNFSFIDYFIELIQFNFKVQSLPSRKKG